MASIPITIDIKAILTKLCKKITGIRVFEKRCKRTLTRDLFSVANLVKSDPAGVRSQGR